MVVKPINLITKIKKHYQNLYMKVSILKTINAETIIPLELNQLIMAGEGADPLPHAYRTFLTLVCISL